MGGFMLLAMIAFLIFKTRMRRKLKKQNQEKRLRELQLSAIRAQMNPHFLFNSLNSVQNLVQKNQGREAHLYLADFAGLIRKVLKNSQQEEVSLAEELETLNQYIRLEQLRFDFEFEQVVDPEIDQNHFMVPSMILQPIAENAILHGLQHKKGNRKLRVEVLKKEQSIQMNLEDNGIGMEASRKIESYSNGIGLNLNKERLKIMQEKYGGNYSFRLIELANENREGTRVEITIPEEQ
jgi:LytS/YehU family sensor histidine kinase